MVKYTCNFCLQSLLNVYPQNDNKITKTRKWVNVIGDLLVLKIVHSTLNNFFSPYLFIIGVGLFKEHLANFRWLKSFDSIEQKIFILIYRLKVQFKSLALINKTPILKQVISL